MSCNMYPKIRLLTKSVQWFAYRHLTRILSRKGPALGGPRVVPTKNRKFLDEPCNFLQLFYFASVFPSGGGTFHPLWLRPCSRAYQVWENSLRNDTGAKYAILTMDPEKNAGLV